MKRLCLVFFIISHCFITAPVAAQQIYVFKEKDGTIRFTNKRPKNQKKVKIFNSKGAKYARYSSLLGKHAAFVRSGKLFKTTYSGYIAAASRRHKVSPSLIRAVIHAESAFNPSAVSPKGAMGLMQLMKSTSRRFSVRNPFNPEDNINGGVKFLSYLIKKYKGNLRLVLAAYNAGEGTVQKYRGVPPYRETQNYITKVLQLQKRYSKAIS